MTRPQAMGVLNVTPESFSDGGDFFVLDKALVRAAIQASADYINYINALRETAALELAAEYALPVCLMHLRGEQRSIQADPRNKNVVDQVAATGQTLQINVALQNIH